MNILHTSAPEGGLEPEGREEMLPGEAFVRLLWLFLHRQAVVVMCGHNQRAVITAIQKGRRYTHVFEPLAEVSASDTDRLTLFCALRAWASGEHAFTGIIDDILSVGDFKEVSLIALSQASIQGATRQKLALMCTLIVCLVRLDQRTVHLVNRIADDERMLDDFTRLLERHLKDGVELDLREIVPVS